MRMRVVLVAVTALLAGALLAAPARDAVGPRVASASAAAHATAAVSKKSRTKARRARLRRFDSCRSLLRYARHHGLRTLGRLGAVPRVGAPVPAALQRGAPEVAPGGAQPVAALPQQQDSSSTNVQEVDVDEPDIVKTNGQTIFAIANGKLNAVDARSASPRIIGSLDLDGSGFGDVLLIHGDRALVISHPP